MREKSGKIVGCEKRELCEMREKCGKRNLGRSWDENVGRETRSKVEIM